MKIGIVDHYYDKIMVSAIVLSGTLKVGDKIKFTRGGEDLFEETVESMQIDGNEVKEAKKGDSIGIKVKQKVKSGAEVFRV